MNDHDLILDGNGLFARHFYASNDTRFAAISSLIGLISLINRVANPEKIDRLLVCWDGVTGKTDKKRSVKPPEYRDQLESFSALIDRVLGGSQYVALRGSEADDSIATAVENNPQSRKLVVSGDKDLWQLHGVHGNTFCYCLNARAIMTREQICEKWSIKHPKQIAIALAIIGDRTDGISGVPRWGEKKAKAIFDEVTDEMPFEQVLDKVYDILPPEHIEVFAASLRVTLLRTDVLGVPNPAKIVLPHPSELDDFEPSFLENYFLPLWDKQK